VVAAVALGDEAVGVVEAAGPAAGLHVGDAIAIEVDDDVGEAQGAVEGWRDASSLGRVVVPTGEANARGAGGP
jgi:hypothetical protein